MRYKRFVRSILLDRAGSLEQPELQPWQTRQCHHRDDTPSLTLPCVALSSEGLLKSVLDTGMLAERAFHWLALLADACDRWRDVKTYWSSYLPQVHSLSQENPGWVFVPPCRSPRPLPDSLRTFSRCQPLRGKRVNLSRSDAHLSNDEDKHLSMGDRTRQIVWTFSTYFLRTYRKSAHVLDASS